jgi:hypothetical protein
MAESDDSDWRDWNAARFTALDVVTPELSAELKAVFATTFLRVSQLSASRLEEAVSATVFDEGVTPKGVRILRAHLPLGIGHPEYEWDGSLDHAVEIATSMAEVAGKDVLDDRAMVGPTGWEPEFDRQGLDPPE